MKRLAILVTLVMLLLTGCGNDLSFRENTAIEASVTQSQAAKLDDAQKNAIAMMYHLATVAEEIRISKDNRVALEEVYSSLQNEINPGAIDEETQGHINDICETIRDFINIESKQERIQYIYNQQKAAAMHELVPDPVAILSYTHSPDWKKLAVNTVFTIADSYSRYKAANKDADQEYFLSGWELDQEAQNTLMEIRNDNFNYMTEIVRKYSSAKGKKSFGKLTLSEQDIIDFAEICANDNVNVKIQRLVSNEETYGLFGNYWIELANCYFETEDYEKCLECIEKYSSLEIDIFRKDFIIVPVLPKAIVASREVYNDKDYIRHGSKFAKAIIDNSSEKDWSVRYFAAQTYVELFEKTKDKDYLTEAYKIVKNNVTILASEQKKLNDDYMDDIENKKRKESEAEQKFGDEEKKAVRDEIKAYNNYLEKARKTELPSVYKPLALNCDLLFALADKLEINDAERNDVEKLLERNNVNVFMTLPVRNTFLFDKEELDYYVEVEKKGLTAPVNLLSTDAVITVIVTSGEAVTVFDDLKIEKVERIGETVDTFEAKYSSKKMAEYKWANGDTAVVEIDNGDFCEPIVLSYTVNHHADNWILPDSVRFEKA